MLAHISDDGLMRQQTVLEHTKGVADLCEVRQQHPVKGKRGLAVGESGRIWQVKESDPCQELPFLFSEYV